METVRAKGKYPEKLCAEIIQLQKRGTYDLMYQNAEDVGRNQNKVIITFSIEDCQGQLITKQDKVLIMWDTYKISMTDLAY